MAKNNAAKQASKHKVKIEPDNPKAGRGGVIPPKETQFGGSDANPRHNGVWKKEDTLRFKMQRIAKMTRAELDALLRDEAVGEFEKGVARSILATARMDDEKAWRILEGLINQDGGYPKQQVEQKNIKIHGILPKPKKEKK